MTVTPRSSDRTCRRPAVSSRPKTSLLHAWAGRPGQPGQLAVLQVQRDQQDAQQFWLALLDAVRHALGHDRLRGTASPSFR